MVDSHAIGACGRGRAGSNPAFSTMRFSDARPWTLRTDRRVWKPKCDEYAGNSYEKFNIHQL